MLKYIYESVLFSHPVTGLDLWGVLVATGVVCIIYCTLVGTTHVKKVKSELALSQTRMYHRIGNRMSTDKSLALDVFTSYLRFCRLCDPLRSALQCKLPSKIERI